MKKNLTANRSKLVKSNPNHASLSRVIGVFLLVPLALTNVLFVFGNFYFTFFRLFDSSNELIAGLIAYCVSLLIGSVGVTLLYISNAKFPDKASRWFLKTHYLGLVSIISFALTPLIIAFTLFSGFCSDSGTCNYLYIDFLSVVSMIVSALPIVIPVLLLVKTALRR